MRTTIAADLSTSRFDTIAVDTVRCARALPTASRTFRNSTRSARTRRRTSTGTFGLASGRRGTLTYHVDVDSLGALNRLPSRRTGQHEARGAASGRCGARGGAGERRLRARRARDGDGTADQRTSRSNARRECAEACSARIHSRRGNSRRHAERQHQRFRSSRAGGRWTECRGARQRVPRIQGDYAWTHCAYRRKRSSRSEWTRTV